MIDVMRLIWCVVFQFLMLLENLTYKKQQKLVIFGIEVVAQKWKRCEEISQHLNLMNTWPAK